MSLLLSATRGGLLTVSVTRSVVVSSGSEDASGWLRIRGPVSALARALATLRYSPLADFNGLEYVRASIEESSDASARAVVAVRVAASVDALAVSFSETQLETRPGVESALAALVVDVDSSRHQFQVEVSSRSGAVRCVKASLLEGLLVLSKNATLRVRGAVTRLNAALAALAYVRDVAASDSVEISVTELGGSNREARATLAVVDKSASNSQRGHSATKWARVFRDLGGSSESCGTRKAQITLFSLILPLSLSLSSSHSSSLSLFLPLFLSHFLSLSLSLSLRLGGFSRTTTRYVTVESGETSWKLETRDPTRVNEPRLDSCWAGDGRGHAKLARRGDCDRDRAMRRGLRLLHRRPKYRFLRFGRLWCLRVGVDRVCLGSSTYGGACSKGGYASTRRRVDVRNSR